MSEINVVAIISPAPGKAQRVKELLAKTSEEVHSKEQSAARYLVTEQRDSGEIIMIETYSSKEALQQHSKSPHFADLMAAFQKEGLLSKAPSITPTVSVAGFDVDRKLIHSKI